MDDWQHVYKPKPKPKRTYHRKAGRSWVSTARGAVSVAKKAFKTAMYIKGLINPELKVHDNVNNSSIPSATLTTYPLNQVAQGDTQVTRDGNSFLNKSLYIKLNFIGNTTAVTTRMRYLIVVDTMANPGAAAPTLADLLENTSYTISSPLNIVASNAGQRFKVILDRTIINISGTSLFSQPRRIYLRLKDHSRFVGALGSDIVSPIYYLCAVSDQATNQPSMEFYSRLRFIDN